MPSSYDYALPTAIAVSRWVLLVGLFQLLLTLAVLGLLAFIVEVAEQSVFFLLHLGVPALGITTCALTLISLVYLAPVFAPSRQIYRSRPALALEFVVVLLWTATLASLVTSLTLNSSLSNAGVTRTGDLVHSEPAISTVDASTFATPSFAASSITASALPKPTQPPPKLSYGPGKTSPKSLSSTYPIAPSTAVVQTTEFPRVTSATLESSLVSKLSVMTAPQSAATAVASFSLHRREAESVDHVSTDLSVEASHDDTDPVEASIMWAIVLSAAQVVAFVVTLFIYAHGFATTLAANAAASTSSDREGDWPSYNLKASFFPSSRRDQHAARDEPVLPLFGASNNHASDLDGARPTRLSRFYEHDLSLQSRPSVDAGRFGGILRVVNGRATSVLVGTSLTGPGGASAESLASLPQSLVEKQRERAAAAAAAAAANIDEQPKGRSSSIAVPGLYNDITPAAAVVAANSGTALTMSNGSTATMASSDSQARKRSVGSGTGTAA